MRSAMRAERLVAVVSRLLSSDLVGHRKSTDETMRPRPHFAVRCNCFRLRLIMERGAARVLTPGVSWVCAQAADPHITSNPGSGCSNKIKYAGGVGAHTLTLPPGCQK